VCMPKIFSEGVSVGAEILEGVCMSVCMYVGMYISSVFVRHGCG
jgi:hypothetical protein